MNLNKLLKKAESFLNADERERKVKKKHLKRVIKKLKKYEHILKEKLETELSEADRARTEKEIALAHAQRKKGLKKLKELMKARKSEKAAKQEDRPEA